MIIVLMVAALISGLLGDVKDTVAIIVILVLNAVIGSVQEFRAERAIEALKKIVSVKANVIRGGRKISIETSEIVPGDLVTVETGNIVPADLRLTEAVTLTVDESALTGESVTVEKVAGVLEEPHLALGDRRNMLHGGTKIGKGRGAGIAISTGSSTELGKIARLIEKAGELKTPLQKRLAVFGRNLAMVAIAITITIFVVGIIRGASVLLMFLTALSLAVAAIPEALPAVVTISLALGAQKMVKKNALIRRLPAVETLGSVTFICSDKTGTLTQNKMKVEEIFFRGERLFVTGEGYSADGKITAGGETLGRDRLRNLEPLLFAAALCNDAEIVDEKILGDPTEVSLLTLAAKGGFEKRELEKKYARVEEVPFDAARKMMTTLHKNPEGELISFTKGAVESVLSVSDSVDSDEGPVEITDNLKAKLFSVAEDMASDGLRVLALASIAVREGEAKELEKGLTLIGLVGILDPPREEARSAVQTCIDAGINPVMITGDHPETAKNIAKRLGILTEGFGILTGQELSEFPLDELESHIRDVRVYARVDPEQKVKIVKALKDVGEVVAMTGDGVNDAPALKNADIGVAMGITGTDVAKEASDMILLDDNFATIVSAVRQGRRIYDNIRKFIKYILSTNSGELWVMFLAPLMGLPLPLTPIQILWINLVTDGLPGLALSVEPEENYAMKRPPRPPDESVFAHGLGTHAIWIGLLMAGVTLLVAALSLKNFGSHWQTMVFTVLAFSQLGHALAMRSERQSLVALGIFSNMWLIGAIALTLVVHFAVVYVPVFQTIFRTEALSFVEVVICLAASSVVFFAAEIEKVVKNNHWMLCSN